VREQGQGGCVGEPNAASSPRVYAYPQQVDGEIVSLSAKRLRQSEVIEGAFGTKRGLEGLTKGNLWSKVGQSGELVQRSPRDKFIE